jgi:transposase-like protein
MRYSASDKYEIIQLIQNSDLSVRQTLKRLSIHRSTFYNWLGRYEQNGIDGLADRKPQPKAIWNKIEPTHRDAIADLALESQSCRLENWPSPIRMSKPILYHNLAFIAC